MSAQPETMQVLAESRLAGLPHEVARPRFNRAEVDLGIVHFGPGAFHRAHQAAYIDDLLQHDRRWGICGVSLKTANLRDAITPQDGLYTLAIVDDQPSHRVIGAIKDVHYAPQSQQMVLRRLMDPRIRVVTITVTEKGYGLTPQGELDVGNGDVRRDLEMPEAPVSLIGYLVEGLRMRRAAGTRPFTVISCDNLLDNGARLKRAVVDFAKDRDRDLAHWIAHEAAFPRTMVDSITPETDADLRRRVATALGVRDAWPVQRESFSQWVIERTDGIGPDWASVGVELTTDVSAYERAKLRLLNGAHSSIAYLGLLAGYETVSQAMEERALSAFVRELMMEEILPTLKAPPGVDLVAYAGSILKRFSSTAVRHNLAQIAWDGSQKLPIRLLGTLADNLAAGRPADRVAMAIAAWMRFVRGRARERRPIVDPYAEQLITLGESCSDIAADDVARFLAIEDIFPLALAGHSPLRDTLVRAYSALTDEELRAHRGDRAQAASFITLASGRAARS